MTNRVVHASLPDGRHLIRLRSTGRWYLEYPDSSRKVVTLLEAVSICTDDSVTVHLGRPGGLRFDEKVRQARGLPKHIYR